MLQKSMSNVRWTEFEFELTKDRNIFYFSGFFWHNIWQNVSCPNKFNVNMHTRRKSDSWHENDQNEHERKMKWNEKKNISSGRDEKRRDRLYTLFAIQLCDQFENCELWKIDFCFFFSFSNLGYDRAKWNINWHFSRNTIIL